MKPLVAGICAMLLSLPIVAGAQDMAAPKILAAEIGKRVAPEGCVIKPVMSDDDYRKCGARPPQPQSASVGSSAPR
jgi:hypothetical protein